MTSESTVFDYFVATYENKQEMELFERLILGFNDLWKKSDENTVHGSTALIDQNINYLVSNIKNHKLMKNRSVLTLKTISEMYSFIAKRTIPKFLDMEERNKNLIRLGENLIKRFSNCKKSILKFSENIFKDEDTVLVIGYSSLLLFVLEENMKKITNLKIKVLELGPELDGHRMYESLLKKGISAELIPDSMLGVEMENVNYVISGAEMITENGGLVNRCGTYTASIIAKTFNIPFYVFSESFKFFRIYPNNILDIPFLDHDKKKMIQLSNSDKRVEIKNVKCDYTPPDLISFVVSDLKIYKPPAISDEMIKLHNC